MKITHPKGKHKRTDGTEAETREDVQTTNGDTARKKELPPPIQKGRVGPLPMLHFAFDPRNKRLSRNRINLAEKNAGCREK